MVSRKYLIFGKNGQLGGEFCRTLTKLGADFSAFDRSEADITSDNIAEVIKESRADIVINCAAYNQVDLAETEKEKAFAVNSEAVKKIAIACAQQKKKFIHYSTDYVFDGAKTDGLYVESDEAKPLNYYGKSKLAGEQFIQENAEDFLIFRTSWVFGNGEQNFIDKLLGWAKTNPYLKIACDEFSVPTSTCTLVDVTLQAVEQDIRGLYHLCNSGFASRYELASHVLKVLKMDNFIYPAYQKDFNLPAKRARFSSMSNGKIQQDLGIEIPHWQEAVEQFLRRK